MVFEKEQAPMKSFLLAAALLGFGLFVVYRELVVEPVVIFEVLTIGGAMALIGAIWLYYRSRRTAR